MRFVKREAYLEIRDTKYGGVVSKKIRVIIADDSALMRKKLGEILNSDHEIEVVAIVRNGRELLDVAFHLKPDVITLDVEMPVLNGLEALGYIMSEMPTPCVMISAFTKLGAKETIKALEYGAVDFVAKTSGTISPDIDFLGPEIINKVKLASRVAVQKLKLIWTEKTKDDAKVLKKPQAMTKVFALASSTGGIQALATILPALPADLPAGVLVVQHMPEGFTKSLAERLNWQSKISVVEAEDGMPITPAKVIIAQGGKHMEVAGSISNPHVILTDAPEQLGVKPCANLMMESAAKIFRETTVGIVLTGMGSDGTLGAKAIKMLGGRVIVESESSCVVYGMPRSVNEAGFADKSLPLGEIAGEMERLVKREGERIS
ncbi:MAG: hypothetical protein ACD_62C00606G0004 [uncultured bacterium]|nr:MAG: hypothetical protein ACD_62C00606G0004 [uncultured bacterium]